MQGDKIEMEEIKVSICCLAYNHAKYIRQTLEGFVNQKTNFKYEVLIHDDASTDGTADVIREYEEKYPDIIKPIYQTENQYSKKINIGSTYQYPRVKGKYIAFCEGDDYWCSDTKLQEQFDLMEKYEDAVLCAHKVRKINEKGEDLEEVYPSYQLPEYIKSSDFIPRVIGEYIFHTSSYFLKSSVMFEMLKEAPEFVGIFPTGDTRILLYFSTKGDVCYINKEYSKYRINSVGSWNSRIKNDDNMFENHIKRVIQGYKLFDEYTGYKYSNKIQKVILRHEFSGLLRAGDKKTLLKPEYKELRKQLPLKSKLWYISRIYLKPVFEIIMKIRQK